ncbi:AraC family transcriptional regulator [Cohnella herbarum]|uniref:AraC family transcriptional regulator n=1 Tax=Cohnella herbarum TaxID=2728023 RepID=A0A7Z2ZM52_9BACL|nr:AraC family transcriptional regulator [Cohnella herbarum]QJD83767.1 AraC family transcriptional regulator [Cohnella herbarum]
MSWEIGWENLSPIVSYANRLVCSPGYRFGPRIVHDHQFIWVAEGFGEAEIQGRKYAATSGDLFHYGPDVPHRFTADQAKPFVLFGLHFKTGGTIPAQGAVAYLQPTAVAEDYGLNRSNEWLIGSQQDSLRIPEYVRFPGSDAERLFESTVHCFQQSDPYHHLLNQANVVRLFSELRRVVRRQTETGSEQGRLMRKVQDLLKVKAAMPYDRAWLREWTNYHENHASSLFLKQYGMSPHEYFLERKLDLAKSLLADSDDSVGEIADRLAFGSVHYFSRLFKARIGYGPIAYRRISRTI